MNQQKSLRGSFLPILIAAFPSVGFASLSYTLARLDDQNQYGYTTAQGLSESGQVLVSTEDDSNSPNQVLGEYVWQNGRERQLQVGINAISPKGSVAGLRSDQTGLHGIIEKSNGQTANLPAPADLGDGLGVTALNDYDQAVGSENPSETNPGGALYWNHGKLDVLGTFGGSDAAAIRINGNAQILISIADGADGNHGDAVLWQNGVAQKIKTPGDLSVAVRDLNDEGEVVGTLGDVNIGETAFSWENGKMQELSPLPGDQSAQATAVNDQGQIVGTSLSSSGAVRPVIWEDGQVINLLPDIKGTGQWSGLDPAQINDQGVISGNGTINGLEPANQPQQRAFVLEPNQNPTAIPLPLGVWLGCTAAPLLIWQIRRGKRVVG